VVICQKPDSDTNMQPDYERPVIRRPDFSEAEEPCYDYRNMENAGKFRGVGQAGKVGSKDSPSIETMPSKSINKKVKRDHEG